MKPIKIWFCDFWTQGMQFPFIVRLLKDLEIPYVVSNKDPDYVIYSCFQNGEHKKYPKAVKVYYTAESKMNNPDADYVIGYLPTNLDGKKKYYCFRNYERIHYMMKNDFRIYQSIPTSIPEKEHFCCFIVSNGVAWQRNKMFELLSKYKFVHSMGAFKNNVKFKLAGRSSPEFYEMIGKFKFCICFENKSRPHYLTEKLYNTVLAGTIPIYWGDPKVGNTFNMKRVVHVPVRENRGKQIEAIRTAIRQVKELDQDPEKYRQFWEQPAILEAEVQDGRVEDVVGQIGKIFK